MYSVLLVDDDSALLDAVEEYFAAQGYQVFRAETARESLALVKGTRLDCVVLDIDLPDQDGFEVCSQIREFTGLPIVFLSAFTETECRVRGFQLGGDDYVCKPFSFQELELRVRSRIHRRYEDRPAEVLRFAGLAIDTGNRTVSYEGRHGDFSRIEFDLLSFLAKHPNQIFSYEQLYDSVWREPINEGRHNLQARMAEVRQKLAALCPGQEFIQTVRRRGYQFILLPDGKDEA